MLEEIVTSLAATVISSAAAYAYGRYQSQLALRQGVQALLRNDMRRSYVYFKKHGCTVSEKSDFENEYNSYHRLGKNGVMTAIYNKVMDMPDAPDE